MEALLKHLVEITGHRDHALLDVSVISALHELIDANQARVLEICSVRDQLFMRPRTWIKDGKVTSFEEGSDTDPVDTPVTDYPALAECIAQRNDSATDIAADGSHMLWNLVMTNDKITACLEITSATPFSPKTLDVIDGIMSVYRNYQNLIDYSERDSLTGLFNRKTFDEKFSKMLAAATAQEKPPMEDAERRLNTDIKEQWLAVVDIDHFKRVNDTFGHLYGDEVLILLANLLRTSFRSQDRIFRFGGEEFVVLLRSTTLENALKVFERFRTNVAKYDFPQVGCVTISLGFSSISRSETPVVILGHADQALYYAKTHGRDQVCHYDELVKSGELKSEVVHESVEFFFDDPA